MKKLSRKITIYITLVIFSILAIFLTYNNYYIYNTTILKISNLTNIPIENTEQYEQHIEGVIQNGKFKGNTLKFNNKSSISGVYDEQLNNSSELFVELSDDGTSITKITGVKRDKYVVILLVIFINLIIYVGQSKGYKTLLTLLINLLITLLAMYFYIFTNLKLNIMYLFIPISLLFIIISLTICSGRNKMTYAAIISSIVSLIVSFGISFIILKIYNGSIHYQNLDYINVLDDYEGIFYLNIMLSGLGAIMDIAITMSSSINELISKDNNISYTALKKSGQEISRDILGTMTNVILFTCYTSVIPIVLLAIKNMSPIFYTIETYGQLEMIRVLTGCISIVLSIPISLYISLLVLKKVNQHD